MMKVKTNMKAGSSSSNPLTFDAACGDWIDSAYDQGYGRGWYDGKVEGFQLC